VEGTLDLTLKDAKEHIAKQVLGFSNRTVATAARHAEGYAYLLVGVEPGSLVGVDTIDNADLVSGINRSTRCHRPVSRRCAWCPAGRRPAGRVEP
jgi:hypothetical protein